MSNIIKAAQTKEDEISQGIEGVMLARHRAADQDYNTILSSRAYITVDNLKRIEAKLAKGENAALRSSYGQVHALLEVQISAVENLVTLQEAWINNVDADEASTNELAHYNEKLNKFKAFATNFH